MMAAFFHPVMKLTCQCASQSVVYVYIVAAVGLAVIAWCIRSSRAVNGHVSTALWVVCC